MNNTFVKIVISLINTLTCIGSVIAQENNFVLSAQYRARAEMRYGYKTLVTDTSEIAFFIGQRARIVFDLKKDNIMFKASIQDARVWGDEELKKDLGGLQVNELWMQYNFKHNLSVKIGRQELVYDDQRLLGNLDWANLTISHDALLLKYSNKDKKIAFHIGGAYNQIKENLFGTTYSLKNYKLLSFAYTKKEFKNEGNFISGIVVVNGLNSALVNDKKLKTTLTIGPLYQFKNKIALMSLGLYYQFGHTELKKKQSAIMINFASKFTIKKFNFGIGIDYISGNTDKTNTNVAHNFSTLYATNHKFYGYMDYFIDIPTDTKNRGLINPYIKLGFEPTKKISTSLDYHYFLLANENNLNFQKVSRNLGSELDFIFDYKPTPILHLQFGYSALFATKNMEYLKGGNANAFNNWAFLMIKTSPTLLYNELKK